MICFPFIFINFFFTTKELTKKFDIRDKLHV